MEHGQKVEYTFKFSQLSDRAGIQMGLFLTPKSILTNTSWYTAGTMGI